jgi:hypothetical protein
LMNCHKILRDVRFVESSSAQTVLPVNSFELQNNVDLNSIKDISKDDTEKNFIHVDDTLGNGCICWDIIVCHLPI